jgi:acyl-CoA dehydrogenase
MDTRAAPDPATARADLARWNAARTDDPYPADTHLRALNRRLLDPARHAALEERAGEFGRTVARRIRPLVERYEQPERLPSLVKYDGAGAAVEEIRFDEAYHEAGRLVWGAGMLRDAGSPGTSFEQATLFYLLSHEGEMGHACPATCTVGLIRALRRAADPAVADRFLPALLDTDYDRADRGAQFLTEVQGGSDVGANAATAVARPDGTYLITGEKWFCSVADAGQFLVTARAGDPPPPGTAGLGCFLVPRTVGGAPNGFSIRRLKDKLGTRAMASAEIDFDGAVAYPIGPTDHGFKTMVSAMLNASRWLNAIGDTGIMRRAYLEASGYAAHRRAFGSRIGDFAAVRGALAGMKAEWLGALHATWALTALDEAIDVALAGGAVADDDDVALHRFLVNGNKLVASSAATGVVRDAVEILGGNGTIETFSVLPRLLRDCVVYEQWEGTHNVLTAQVLRDLGRLGLGGVVHERLARMLKGVADPDLGPTAGSALDALEELGGLVARSLEDAAHGAAHFRRHLERLVRVVQVAALLEAADGGEPAIRGELAAVAAHLTGRYLDPSHRPELDPGHADRVDAVIGDDLS